MAKRKIHGFQTGVAYAISKGAYSGRYATGCRWGSRHQPAWAKAVETGSTPNTRGKRRKRWSKTRRRQENLVRRLERVDKPEKPEQIPMCPRHERPMGAGKVLDTGPKQYGTKHSYQEAIQHSADFGALMDAR